MRHRIPFVEMEIQGGCSIRAARPYEFQLAKLQEQQLLE